MTFKKTYLVRVKRVLYCSSRVLVFYSRTPLVFSILVKVEVCDSVRASLTYTSPSPPPHLPPSVTPMAYLVWACRRGGGARRRDHSAHALTHCAVECKGPLSSHRT